MYSLSRMALECKVLTVNCLFYQVPFQFLYALFDCLKVQNLADIGKTAESSKDRLFLRVVGWIGVEGRWLGGQCICK